MRWLLRALGALVLLLFLAALAVLGVSEWRLTKPIDAPRATLPIPSDSKAVERGAYLASTVSVCVECHGPDLGGQVVADDPGLGRIVAPNLTRGKGGLGDARTDQDLARAIRYGVGPDDLALMVMPSDDYNHLTDEDLGAVVAYIRSLPPVDQELPAEALRPFGRLLMALGQLDVFAAARIDMEQRPPKSLAPEVSKDYGRYLANIAGCTGCHGPGLSGGSIPGAPPDFPPAANLTPSGEVGSWDFADFRDTLRSGKNPKGRALSEEMPWKSYGKMSDQELRAIWLFVSSVPAKDAGQR